MPYIKISKNGMTKRKHNNNNNIDIKMGQGINIDKSDNKSIINKIISDNNKGFLSHTGGSLKKPIKLQL